MLHHHCYPPSPFPSLHHGGHVSRISVIHQLNWMVFFFHISVFGRNKRKLHCADFCIQRNCCWAIQLAVCVSVNNKEMHLLTKDLLHMTACLSCSLWYWATAHWPICESEWPWLQDHPLVMCLISDRSSVVGWWTNEWMNQLSKHCPQQRRGSLERRFCFKAMCLVSVTLSGCFFINLNKKEDAPVAEFDWSDTLASWEKARQLFFFFKIVLKSSWFTMLC